MTTANDTFQLDVLEAALLVARPAEVAQVLQEKAYSQPQIAGPVILENLMIGLVALRLQQERQEGPGAPILAKPYQDT